MSARKKVKAKSDNEFRRSLAAISGRQNTSNRVRVAISEGRTQNIRARDKKKDEAAAAASRVDPSRKKAEEKFLAGLRAADKRAYQALMGPSTAPAKARRKGRDAQYKAPAKKGAAKKRGRKK